mmetsp:Transcript_14138/g.20723  ORF Transcript_14138/g.20723 Transcript_14138/m.20723 type:complete len:513 (-) Transcript_14138:154-1692(-)|eukprot:CAMPEP_0194049648 /NCGR_PEP_ID=MMETSP0009_2-20130614/30806_1 /TAXON_ID=210454 /ORGANISM="Grammatophora oceanica, Strain CCMP 410" /LENGTH=512 /DNA_ID=CAMNT_0038695853 /DNA_START=147 /DNA_END=1685 /DNA_ORIENTATION=+
MFSSPTKKKGNGSAPLSPKERTAMFERLYKTETASTAGKRVDSDWKTEYANGGQRMNVYGFPVSPPKPDLPTIRGNQYTYYKNKPSRSVSPKAADRRPKSPTRRPRPPSPTKQQRPPSPTKKKTVVNKKTRPKPVMNSSPKSIKYPPNVMELFDSADNNGNGLLSLAEIDKVIVAAYPNINHKAALMRSYKSADTNNDGFIRRNEWPSFVQFVVYYNNLWAVFNYADADSDKRITVEELEAANLNLPQDMTAQQVFDEMDTNHGGYVLFEEACLWMAKRKREVEDEEEAPEQSVDAKDVLGDLLDDNDKNVPRRVSESPAFPDPGEEKAQIPPPEKESTKASTEGASVVGATSNSNKIPTKEKLQELWSRLDGNGNNMLSLAELDKGVMEVYPQWDDKPALMRAYKASDQNGDGFVRKSEFRYFFALLQSYHELWKLFDMLDGGDAQTDDDTKDDRRLTLEELQAGWPLLRDSPLVPTTSPEEIYAAMDTNGGGYILFDEFCQYVAKEFSSK